MQLRGIACALALVLVGQPAIAQDAVKVVGKLHEPGVNAPAFDSPRVDVYVLSDKTDLPSDDLIVDEDSSDLSPPDYDFSTRFKADNVRNNYVMVVASANGYFPVTPDNRIGPRIRRIRNDMIGQDIEMGVALKRRSVLAELYRSETNSILRDAQPTPETFERAMKSAANAVEIDPRLDNYLMALKVTSRALSRGETFNGLVASRTDIQALGNFDGLPKNEQWRIQSELLATLMRVPQLDMPLTRTDTAAELAIRLGDEMIASLDFSDPQDTALPVTRIFHTLSVLHSEQKDCQSLIDNNERALSHAEALSSNWASQRALYLSWADCLEELSGGAGQTDRSADAYISETAGNPFLKQQWTRFSRSADRIRAQLNFATNSQDQRLKELVQTAQLITDAEEP
ncbi:hypothetical protein [Sulfitobacter aestuariivivens]|uniref:Secreted protein n=1 Tax=Sulfitobacter aestuariivivens TaxID=2766981 RepID=A0A927HFN6_9RHOB|nr:hypothetical protein [Sulfitobacter aestuariivivens]MBD3664628.1 hypothetical protein [Sulfitobacter aestuariivivens]